MKKYRATINVHFKTVKDNNLTRLNLCLKEAQWIHVERGSFILETTDINEIWYGIGYVARYSHKVGELNSLTFHVQSSDDFSKSMERTSELSGRNALEEISKLPFPCP